MPNAEATLEPLRSGLMPVPAVPQGGVCEVCHSASDPSFRQCYPCHEAARRTGVWEVLPIAMSVHGGLLHRHLRGYKDDPDPEVQRSMTRRLAALTAVFLRAHARCLGTFESVAIVPSVRRVALEPVVRQVQVLSAAVAPTLEATLAGDRPLAVDRFAVTRTVRDERILVFDDTFTSGASAFSACAALRDAGAQVVGPLIIGRHIRPDRVPRRPWSTGSSTIHGPRPAAVAAPASGPTRARCSDSSGPGHEELARMLRWGRGACGGTRGSGSG